MNARQVQRTLLVFALLLPVVPGSVQGAGSPGAKDVPAPQVPVVEGPEIWKDASRRIAARVNDLVRRLSLEEKVSQMRCNTAAIPRLGIPAYSHRNECLHGVVNGTATVFPQAIGMAATWDTPLIGEEADAIATEARAKHNDYVAAHAGNSAYRFGLSFYSPNINIFRDPRWGRGQETYGEDPFLTAQIAVAFIRGLQGNDPRYVKIMACAKHFAVHSGPEPERHRFDARPPQRDLYETYLPAFEAAVREGQVGSVMGAYTALYGVPDCANRFLLTDLLRQQWGFGGFVVSDGGAIWDIWAQHKYVPAPEAAAVAAVKAGCDFCSGSSGAAELPLAKDWTPDARGWLTGGEDYNGLSRAVQKGLISEEEIDVAVGRELAARFHLGMFDPPAMVPYAKITLAQNDTPEHRALALKVARESIVLLKNDGLLPLDRAKRKRIAVIGANADSAEMLLGDYGGTQPRRVTILAGIKAAAGPKIEVTCQKGCPLALKNDNSNKPTPEVRAQAVAAAKAADVVIYVGGLDSSLEDEQENDPQAPYAGFFRGDRTRIELPPLQTDLIEALHATGKPVVLVNCSGSAVAMPWEAEHVAAILQAWYPGEEGGRAVADVLFGDTNPAGRLPITFYRSTADLPPFDDYSMSNRTYRYFRSRPLFSFGHGLSYTTFEYSAAQLDARTYHAKDTLKLAFTVRNHGSREGDEVPQIYLRHVHSAVPQPKLALCGFTRIHLLPGQATTVAVDVPAKQLRYWDTTEKQYRVEPGNYELLIGGASDDIRLRVPLRIDSRG